MSNESILITQCLQKDFVQPLKRFDPLPNHLHIGFEEAKRLMGENPAEGPVAMTMQWAYQQPEEALKIIHIRDWHNPKDTTQKEHLHQFGGHCLAGSEGAEFAFDEDHTSRAVEILNATGINDFVDTNLAEILEKAAPNARVGLMGVWTEAKISFLAYDIRARFPEMEIALCSALTASSSRAHHFMALEQLKRLLGVQVFSSVGEFTKFLTGKSADLSLATPTHADLPKITVEREGFSISETDHELIRYLFRDCQHVDIKPLGGGFSGNLVLSTKSVDIYGHQQVPHVVKIGEQATIGQERASFERIEDVLGNSAPNITEFADLKGRGALKYRYAAMGDGFSSTFKKVYEEGASQKRLERYLKIVFGDQLGRFYKVANLEPSNLLEYYQFSSKFAPSVRKSVEKVLGAPANTDRLTLPHGHETPNPCLFYEKDLDEVQPMATGTNYFSYIHGDLNGANIVIDAQDNIWLIDFFHTGPGHVLRDLIKLENDLLYIFSKIENDEEFNEAIQLADLLIEVYDLATPLPANEEIGFKTEAIQRAYETLRFLRSFYPPLIKLDRNPLQLFIGQLRYAAHTMSFDESNAYQKELALYMSGHLSAKITSILRMRGTLRIDWLDEDLTFPGKMGLTILPGRRDIGRSLEADIATIQEKGVTHIVCLIPRAEMSIYGVDGLLDAYEKAGFTTKHLPILDQSTCTLHEMHELVQWMDAELSKGATMMLHCVGGLGRSGIAAASYLKYKGMNSEEAIATVRTTRSPRALENDVQEDFVREF